MNQGMYLHEGQVWCDKHKPQGAVKLKMRSWRRKIGVYKKLRNRKKTPRHAKTKQARSTETDHQSQYKDRRWRQLAVKLKKERGCCESCGSQKFLQVHHKVYYQDGRPVWDYPESTLMVVCGSCHRLIHKQTPLHSFFVKP